ncbi:hypothetical protein L6452_18573 [Arctium lappa]|uniref:Uncharacterized protein n=1 Tax=Arctium lappa TaxID=4217 RepID=A0ACB9C6F4_ARCLA|nr:hypothetical protein L6452_18573 [Arctium lappa]
MSRAVQGRGDIASKQKGSPFRTDYNKLTTLIERKGKLSALFACNAMPIKNVEHRPRPPIQLPCLPALTIAAYRYRWEVYDVLVEPLGYDALLLEYHGIEYPDLPEAPEKAISAFRTRDLIRLSLVAAGGRKESRVSFQDRRRTAPSMYSGPPPIAGRCARYDKGPWEKPMKSQGRASEPAQAKIGTRRLEEQPEKGKAVETADSPIYTVNDSAPREQRTITTKASTNAAAYETHPGESYTARREPLSL